MVGKDRRIAEFSIEIGELKALLQRKEAQLAVGAMVRHDGGWGDPQHGRSGGEAGGSRTARLQCQPASHTQPTNQPPPWCAAPHVTQTQTLAVERRRRRAAEEQLDAAETRFLHERGIMTEVRTGDGVRL